MRTDSVIVHGTAMDIVSFSLPYPFTVLETEHYRYCSATETGVATVEL